MPQAPEELRAKFSGGDGEALDILRENYVVDCSGVIHPKTKDYQPTKRENEAIDYLWLEWDYGYASEPVAEEKK